ncbi:MAG: fimbrillin family protein [Bacteroidaceae bacterium]|nr:fimbrillin family protein [Bacteroidaceae bacterium]
MNKKTILFAAAVSALAFASCSQDEAVVADVPATQAQLADGAVGFEVYTPRATRAGQTAAITNETLKTSGFGVFGYYTDNNDYDPQATPNFMYNQKVEWDGTDSYWKYEPVKYWPNEYGSTAISDDADKVTFFAYAPYVEVTPSVGKVVKANDDDDKWGITALSRNTATGDPIVKYIASFDQDKSVDLLWGVNKDVTTWELSNDAPDQTFTVGMPWLNVQRPKVSDTQKAGTQRVKFQFEHALAQLSVNIDADVDKATVPHDNEVDNKTRIWVRSITFKGFAMKGALNLNNTVANSPLWIDYNGVSDFVNGEDIIIYDGLKDGKEGTASNLASNEKSLGFNPQLIQSSDDIDNAGTATAAWKADNKGVTHVAVSLFRKWDGTKYVASDAPVMVIPTEDDVEVEIVYDVETIDKNLANYVSDGRTNGSTIENRISKTVTFAGSSQMVNGKHYTLNLHLGMNSVKLEAAVTDWEDVAEEDVELPANPA